MIYGTLVFIASFKMNSIHSQHSFLQMIKTYTFYLFVVTGFFLLTGFYIPLVIPDESNYTTYQKSPFKRLDRLSVNKWWKRKESKIIQMKVPRSEVIAFGIYTVSDNILKLSAQLFPLYPHESKIVRLELFINDEWTEVQQQSVNEIGWSALFRIENWNAEIDVDYRLRHGDSAVFQGLIRKEPHGKEEIVIAALSCNSKKDRGDRESIVKNILYQNPDMIFFAGDQSYDHREHTAAWLKFGMQFRETFRERPCISIPDDHDVGMYNLWGENGKKGKGLFAFSGGYRFHPEYVRMVERCQTAHLPDPYDPAPVQQGIGVYYTQLLWGGIDYAIIEDRKFKSGPKGKVKGRFIRADHLSRKVKDPLEVDLPGLELLGKRQLDFLDAWSKDTMDNSIKVVLSQSPFFSGPHLHGKKKTRINSDFDSNGWPQLGRNAALQLIKNANAIHIAGDQHIAFVVEQGIDTAYTGVIEFTVPAIVNSIYSRWWLPENAEQANVAEHQLPWAGKYQDGFGNRFTMHAYANPDSQDNGAGYGIIRFNKKNKQVTFECWSRFTDVSRRDAQQFKGWPIIFNLK